MMILYDINLCYMSYRKLQFEALHSRYKNQIFMIEGHQV